MTATKRKSGKGTNSQPRNDSPFAAADVLTLSEAAAYLRVAEAEIVRMVEQQALPGRMIGGDWRFLKSALQDWLRTPAPRGSKEAVLSAAGSWKDDPHLEEELRAIHKRRGRSVEDEK